VREKGIEGWAKEKGYGRKNMAEASFSRLKRIFGDGVRARGKERQESEIRVRIWMLNKMMEMDGIEKVGYMALR